MNNISSVIKNIIRNPRAFFLQNGGLKQTIAKNTFWLSLAEGIAKILKLVLIIFIARILGAEEYGKFTFAIAFVSFFAVFSDLGISQILIREFAKDKKKESQFSSILSLKIILLLLSFVLITVFSFFITPDVVIRKIILIFAFMILAHGVGSFLFAFLQARQKMEYEAWARIIESVLVFGLGFLVLFKLPSVVNLSFAYFFGAFFIFIFIFILFHKKIQPLSFKINFGVWKHFLILSWPLAFIAVFSIIYNQIDSIMMGYWGMIIETGWYNAAYKIVIAVFIPINLLGRVFFPPLSAAFHESKEKFQRIWLHYFRAIILLSFPIVIGAIVLAPRIIDFIYDPSFYPSILSFQILMAMAGVAFFNSAFGQLLIIANRQKTIFLITFLAALLNIILNFTLIPVYSLYGAAATTLITFVFIFILFLKFTSGLALVSPFSPRLFPTFGAAIIAAALMGILLNQPVIYNLNVFLSVSIGALAYFSAFFGLKIMLKYFIQSAWKN